MLVTVSLKLRDTAGAPPRCHDASRISLRVSTSTSNAEGGSVGKLDNPTGFARLSSHLWRKSDFRSRRRSSSSRWFRAGTAYCAVRWKTKRRLASFATWGISCTPVEPVPITPTRLFAKSTPSAGQLAVWYCSPANVSAPLNFGVKLSERAPAALTRYRAETVSSLEVRMIHLFCSSSNRA